MNSLIFVTYAFESANYDHHINHVSNRCVKDCALRVETMAAESDNNDVDTPLQIESLCMSCSQNVVSFPLLKLNCSLGHHHSSTNKHPSFPRCVNHGL